MNNGQRKTLAAIFTHPTPSGIRWKDAVSLFRALGADIDQSREGSRFAFVMKMSTEIYHKPHPSPYVSQPSVRQMRGQLQKEGVQP